MLNTYLYCINDIICNLMRTLLIIPTAQFGSYFSLEFRIGPEFKKKKTVRKTFDKTSTDKRQLK